MTGHDIDGSPMDRLHPSKRPGHWFWGSVRREWRAFGQIALAAAVINLFALGSSLFIMTIYDRVIPNDAIESLVALTLGMVLVLVFDFLLKMLRGHVIDVAGQAADERIGRRVFGHVLRIPLEHRAGSSGAFAATVREFESLRDFLTSASLAAFVDLPFVALFLGVILIVGGPLVWVPALAVPLVVAAGLLVQPMLARAAREGHKAAQTKHGVLVETVGALEGVKGARAERVMARRWRDSVELQAAIQSKSRFWSQLAINLASFVQQGAQVAIVFLGVFLVREGTVSIGALIASVILCGRALAPLAQIATLLTRLNHAAQSYRAIDRLMALAATVEPGRTYLTRPRIDGRVTFRGVSFTYPRGRQPALTQAGFIVQPGEKVAVLGRIGSGKSTIVRLAAGLYAPSDGTVLLDDVDLRQLHPDELSRHVTAVLQDAPLFSGTVRDNILMGADEPSDERMLAAAGVAGVHDFIGGMTDGYDVMLGERGEGLSGGQRQAIALARALVSPARVLVMDEPTASMDVRSETLFVKRLKPHLGDRTLILVTHRMSMLELVDRVIVLDHGRVVADGPKAEVLSALQGPVADAPANRPDPVTTPAKMPKREATRGHLD